MTNILPGHMVKHIGILAVLMAVALNEVTLHYAQAKLIMVKFNAVRGKIKHGEFLKTD